MAHEKLPYIEEDDYQEVRDLINEGMPETYAEWQKKWIDKMASDCRKMNHHEPRYINVSPQDFAQFLHGRNLEKGTLQNLLQFTITEAAELNERAKGDTGD